MRPNPACLAQGAPITGADMPASTRRPTQDSVRALHPRDVLLQRRQLGFQLGDRLRIVRRNPGGAHGCGALLQVLGPPVGLHACQSAQKWALVSASNRGSSTILVQQGNLLSGGL
jgi:hypothetical protein